MRFSYLLGINLLIAFVTAACILHLNLNLNLNLILELEFEFELELEFVFENLLRIIYFCSITKYI